MKLKLLPAIVTAALLALFYTGCERAPDIVEGKLNVLGTFADITIAGLPDAAARVFVQAVEEDLGQLDHIGYTFAPGGELHELNEAIAQGKPMAVSSELGNLIESARELYATSGGLVNPAAGELIALWEFHCDGGECTESPYPEEVQRLVEEKQAQILASRPSMEDVVLNKNEVTSRNPSVKLEFGDMIRGYALDKCADHLKSLGVENAMIDINGIIRSLGSRGEHPWWTPVLDASGKHSLGYIELDDDEAIATVRAFDRSIGRQDFVYRHVVDPRTGIPAKDVKAVTVIHHSALRANAAATALLLAGIDDWADTANRMGVRSLMMITQDGAVYTSTTMEERVHWKQRLEHQHLVP